jgi:hypothetical protein
MVLMGGLGLGELLVCVWCCGGENWDGDMDMDWDMDCTYI